VDWNKFRDKLETKLANWGVPTFIKTQGALNHACAKLTSIIQETTEEEVPKAKLGPHAKHWWTKELMELRKDMLQSQRLACKLRHEPGNPHWEHYKEA
jgi:hypothetical protein